MLIPTLVHERGAGDPSTKLLAVKTTLVSEGWSSEVIVPWSISLSDLAQRLMRLAIGSD